MKILPLKELPQEQKNDFFTIHWGSPQMVISSGVYDCSKLDGFAALDENRVITGLVTYVRKESFCEIISLDSKKEGQGIGTKLVSLVEQTALEHGCYIIKLVTTNDNLHAMGFY